MKFLALFLFFATALFADQFTLENETSSSNVAIQWASSARMVQESNDSLAQGDPIAPSTLYHLRQPKATIAIPKDAAYFRVLVWKTKQSAPDLLTNWVELVPGKTYRLKEEHLTPLLLINGMGC